MYCRLWTNGTVDCHIGKYLYCVGPPQPVSDYASDWFHGCPSHLSFAFPQQSEKKWEYGKGRAEMKFGILILTLVLLQVVWVLLPFSLFVVELQYIFRVTYWQTHAIPGCFWSKISQRDITASVCACNFIRILMIILFFNLWICEILHFVSADVFPVMAAFCGILVKQFGGPEVLEYVRGISSPPKPTGRQVITITWYWRFFCNRTTVKSF